VIPQIFTVSPSQGLPDGLLRVEITGYGFRVPAVETPEDEAGGFVPETVRVLFGTASAEAVLVFSAERLVAVAPAYNGLPETIPASVSVSAMNLDDDGVPIPGETASKAAAFSYRREDLTAGGTSLEWLVRQVIRAFRMNVTSNVECGGSSPDFSDDPLSGAVAVSDLPALVLVGPSVADDKARRHRSAEPILTEEHGGTVTVDQPPLCKSVSFGIIAIGRSKTEVLALQAEVMRYVERRSEVVLLDVPGGSAVNPVRWSLGEWRAADRPADAVFSSESELRLDGVLLGLDYGLVGSGTPTDDLLTYQTEDSISAVLLSLPERP
jgi:hypothetical protein